MELKKIAILGASYLQRPLVLKAKEMMLETHVFAWQEGNVVNDITDYYYDVSILNKERILEICKEINIDGIVSIASDIAMTTVNYVASNMNLVGNSIEATLISTDKFEMRKALSKNNIACPKFYFFSSTNFKYDASLTFPVIVKPTDRSGSRGVTKILKPENVNDAINKALNNSIGGRVIVEEFVEGREFSVEMISYKGKHFELAITDKIKTGAPFFVETEHHQPADVSKKLKTEIYEYIKKALTALCLKNGASHSEIIVTKQGEIRVVEIAGRMGGDFIGSDMVFLSTGYDYVRAVLEVSLGSFQQPNYEKFTNNFSGVQYILPKSGIIKEIHDNSEQFEEIKLTLPLFKIGDKIDEIVDGSYSRAGIILYQSKKCKPCFIADNILKFVTI